MDNPIHVIPKRNNPNVEEIYAPSGTTTTGYEYDYVSHQQQEHDGDGEEQGDFKKLCMEPEPIGDGVFLYDHEQDVPAKTYTFENLKRHLESRARIYYDPVIKFVADVAVKTGTSVEQMLIKSDVPLVNTSATTVQELVTGSKLPTDTLVELLIDVLTGILKNFTAPQPTGTTTTNKTPISPYNSPPLTPKKTSVPSTPMVPVKIQPVSPFSFTPGPTTKDEKKTDTLNALIGHREALISHHQNNNIAIDLIGANGNDGMAGGGGKDERVVRITDDLIELFRRQSFGDTEHEIIAGIGLVKPEVVSSIETAYEDIRRISGAHSEFKLWHLMTSPSVRHNFAQMIAAMLNSAPSELQYPHYQKSVRDNGAVTGSRVTTGLWTQVRATKLYKEKRMWFQNVHYGVSTIWRDADSKLPSTRDTLRVTRESLRSNLINFKNLLIVGPTSLWGQLGMDTGPYKQSLVQLDGLQQTLDNEKRTLELQQRRYNDMIKDKQQPAILQGQQTVITLAMQRVKTAEMTRDARISQMRIDLMADPAWTQAVAVDGVALIPFVSTIAGGGQKLERIDRIDMDTFLPLLSQRLIPRLSATLRRIDTWHGADVDDVRMTIQNVLASAHLVIRDATSLRSESNRMAELIKVQHQFSDNEKKELFYTPPSSSNGGGGGSGYIRPVKDYLSPESVYASI